MEKKLTILGSTGSIGVQTLQVVDMYPHRFKIVALAARGSKSQLLEEQIIKYKPQLVSVNEREYAFYLRSKYAMLGINIVWGQQGLIDAAVSTDAEMVVAAISGAAGLVPTIAAIRTGKDVALANKETLVIAGALVKREIKERNVKLLPVDSEHSAIAQCLLPGQIEFVQSILLTASGGPFRGYTTEQLSRVTVKEALNHPNWTMGSKITIDSATLMNKGLEVIEAHWLFGLDYDHIEVVVHPQSIIHSMVRYRDGSVLAHLGVPDMRIPIQYALTYPERWANSLQQVDFTNIGALTFEKPDVDTFPCLRLAYNAGRSGGVYPVVLNAANEVAVQLFLDGIIKFTQIPVLIERALEKCTQTDAASLEEILELDRLTRLQMGNKYIKGLVKE